MLLDTRLTVLRVLIGIAIGCTAALPVGYALAWFPLVRAMFDPLISFSPALPPLALIPLVIVYLGIDTVVAQISVLVYAAFFSAVIVIYESVPRSRTSTSVLPGRSAPRSSSCSGGWSYP
jgi:NitT/TauT family transport system permease protein